MAFLRPEFAWILPVALLALGLRRFTRLRRFAASTTVRWLDPDLYRASLLRRAPAALAGLAFALVTLALMDPVIPYAEGQIRSRGVDIVLVLDLSSSMQEVMDLRRPPPTPRVFTSRDALTSGRPGHTRLVATTEALRDFISFRPDDRIGLVVFSDNAYVVSPLTFDHANLRRYVGMVDDQILRGEGMTAIGEGIGLATYLLARQSQGRARRSRAIVVFTDGENNFGRDPLDAMRESDVAGIRVHMVGVDLEDEVKTKPDVVRLIATVRQYGGRYFNADTSQELKAASLAIDALEKGTLTNTVYLRNMPVFAWFALAAILSLGLACGLRAIPYFIDLTA